MNDQLSDKVIERIDAEQITPFPHWRFVLLHGIFWLLAILSIIVGSCAVACILFLFADYRLHGLLPIPHDITELLLLIPYIWLVVLGLFLIVTDLSIKHTRKGYKYGLGRVVLISIILSFIFGFVLYTVGMGEITHKFFNGIPFYNSATYEADEILEFRQMRLLKNQ
jgi:hypothetical protein